MPYPEKPTITYDYSAFQESQGSNDFPGTYLDVDLANLKAALDATIDFVSATIRSDGFLYASKIEGSVTGAAGAGYGGTSSTSLAIGSGSKSFTTQSGLAYVVGSRVRAASAAAPTTKWMEGVVTAYSGTGLTLAVDAAQGSGSAADWSFSLAGQPGTGGYVPTAADRMQYGSAIGVVAETPLTAAGRALLDDADAAAQRTTMGVAIGTDVQAYSAMLAAIAALSSTGLLVRTGSGTVAARLLTAPAAGISITNTNGVSGNPTLALANDLAALEGLSSTGFATRTGSDAWSQRSIAATGPIVVTDGDGVSGNPTIALESGSQGDVLVRKSTGWARLTAGTSGYFLKTLGAGADPAWAAIPGGGDLLSTNNLSDVANVDTARANLGFPAAAQQLGFRRLSINGNFAINRRAVSGTVTLTAGQYGHDGWKGGASGGTYTFSTSGLDTTANISSGTLCQVVLAKDIAAGVHVLSWSGTATARVYQGSPTGSYVSSPIVTSSLTANTDTILEFSTGTFGLVQFERGSVVTPYERNPLELLRCWERGRRWNFASGALIGQFSVFTGGTESYGKLIDLAVPLISSPPTVSVSSPSHFSITASAGRACSSMPLAGSTATMIGGSVFSSSTHGSAGDCSSLASTSSSAWIDASVEP